MKDDQQPSKKGHSCIAADTYTAVETIILNHPDIPQVILALYTVVAEVIVNSKRLFMK